MAPDTLMVVLARSLEAPDRYQQALRVQELNAWYDAHVVDIVTTPGIVGGARYDLIEVQQGAAAPYSAFYDLDTDDVEQVAADLAKVMAVCPSGGIPANSDGRSWLQIDGFAYFTRVSAPTTRVRC